MARKISVEIVGDSASLQRSFQRSGASAKLFERDLSKSARGVAAASLSFHGLGRALSFASGYFLASGGIVFGLKAATKAAVDHQAAQAQLAAAMTHAGVSFKDYGAQVEDTLRKQRDLAGFSENDTNASFTKLLRTTRSVSAATRDNALSMEIARGAGIGLNAASNIVNKTLAGQTTGLRRLGVELPKGVSGYRALQIAGAKYAGSVTAFAGTAAGGQARLTNALHETEVTVGTALLPTITKYTTELADWLNKSGNQQRIQRDVNAAVKDGTAVVKVFAGVVHGASDAVGGFSNLVKVLIGLKVARTLFAWRAATVAFGASAGAAGAAGSVAALSRAVSRLAAIGAVSIAIRFPGLAAGLSGLLAVPGAVAAATAAAVLAASGDAPKVSAIPKSGRAALVAGLASHGDIPESVLKQAAGAGGIDPATPAGNALKNPKFVAFLYAWAAQHGLLPQPAGGAGAEASAKAAAGQARSASLGSVAAGSSGVGVQGLDALSKIQNQVAQARLAAAKGSPGAQKQLVAALKAEIDYDAKYAAIQEKLAKQGGKNAKKHAQTMQALLADEASAYSEISSGQAKVESGASKAAKAAAAAAKKRAEAAKKRAQAQEQAAQTFTVPMALQIAAAKAATTVSTKDDVKVAREIDAFARKMIASGKKKGQALVDAWNEIASQMGIIGQTQQSQVHAVVASSQQLVRGIHFASKADKMAVEARIAQVQSHGGRLPTGHGVLGQSITIQNLHVHGVQSVDDLLSELQKRSRHGTAQRRGPHAGAYMGLH